MAQRINSHAVCRRVHSTSRILTKLLTLRRETRRTTIMLSQFWPSSAVVLTDLNRNWWLNTPGDVDDLAVAHGLQVTVELAVWLSDKTLVASNRGHHPLTYIHGQQQILPSL